MNSSRAPLAKGLEIVFENPAQEKNDSSDNEADDYSSSSSDVDNYVPKPKPLKIEISVKDQLANVLADIKNNGKQFERFSDEVKGRLADKTGDPREPTTLHILAVKQKDELPPDKDLKPLIEFLVRHRPLRLLMVTDEDAGLTPLHLAISQKNRTMVNWMCQAYDEIDKVLATQSHKKKNCVHVAIEKAGRIAKSLIDLASAETLSAKNDDGNTPLHLAVESKRCREGQLELIRAIVEKCDHRMRDVEDGDFNKQGLSPYLHHILTCEQRRAERDKKTFDEEKKKAGEEKDSKKKVGPISNTGEGGQNRPSSKYVTTTAAPSTPTEEDPAVRRMLRRTSTQMDDPMMLKKPELSGLEPSSSRYAKTTRPPPDASVPESRDDKKVMNMEDPLAKVATPKRASNKDGQSSVVDEIREFLKTHYLRARRHDVALEILYGRNPTSEKTISFDLSGYSAVTKSEIQKNISILNFETILQYVDIPKINTAEDSSEANTKRPRARLQKPDSDGRTDLETVFQWLKNAKVTTILKVSVDDLEPPAHSDPAIERTLDGRGVEIWDWKKEDICSEVICSVAPGVRKVHLYWSGRNAVLRAWSEEEGLPQLKQLDRIDLHVLQGCFEPLGRIKDNVDAFKSRIFKQVARVRPQEIADELAEEMEKEVVKEMVKERHSEKSDVEIREKVRDQAEETAKVLAKMIREGVANRVTEILEDSGRERAQNWAKKMAMENAMKMIKELAKQTSKGLVGDLTIEDAKEAVRVKAQKIAAEMAKHHSDIEIEPHYPKSQPGSSHDTSGEPATGHTEEPQRHEWIQHMTSFKQLLFTAEANFEWNGAEKIAKCIKELGGPIVVALIDDGIEVKELKLEKHGNITGRSFYRKPLDPDVFFPYYLSSGGHGTVMASQIHRICPKAELCVLKLEDRIHPQSKKREITLKSAAQAIREAVKKKVDIISMSWTITPPTNPNKSQVEDIKELEKAIMEAAQEGILMFCSASDEGAKQDSTFPSKATNKIFKIGGADANGGLYKPVGDINSVDFILPGQLVEGEGLSEGAINKVEFWSGSSVATALAAGLAALILYCAQIRILRANGAAKDKAKRDFNSLKQYEKMMKAFKNIGTTNASNGRYLTVWEVFGGKVNESMDRNMGYDSSRQPIDFIADVAGILCSKL